MDQLHPRSFRGGYHSLAGPEAWWLEGFVGAEWKIADCILDFRKQQLNEQLMAATANAMVIKRDLRKSHRPRCKFYRVSRSSSYIRKSQAAGMRIPTRDTHLSEFAL